MVERGTIQYYDAIYSDLVIHRGQHVSSCTRTPVSHVQREEDETETPQILQGCITVLMILKASPLGHLQIIAR